MSGGSAPEHAVKVGPSKPIVPWIVSCACGLEHETENAGEAMSVAVGHAKDNGVLLDFVDESWS